MRGTVFGLLLVLGLSCDNQASRKNADVPPVAPAAPVATAAPEGRAAPSAPAAPAKPHKVVRYGLVTGVKPEKLEYYKNLHAHPWPAVTTQITKSHFQNFNIYLQKIGDQYFLFNYVEYTGDDIDTDLAKMAADPETQRWMKETDPCLIPLPQAAAKKEAWTESEEIFHLD
ncbi:MAG: hypothetical protein H6Q90_1300 [Deltaproteobacteria bacterium]|nr:hypothetical protein [Deltaproteobacteria bacterium]